MRKGTHRNQARQHTCGYAMALGLAPSDTVAMGRRRGILSPAHQRPSLRSQRAGRASFTFGCRVEHTPTITLTLTASQLLHSNTIQSLYGGPYSDYGAVPRPLLSRTRRVVIVSPTHEK
jgi:hypothetical protein